MSTHFRRAPGNGVIPQRESTENHASRTRISSKTLLVLGGVCAVGVLATLIHAWSSSNDHPSAETATQYFVSPPAKGELSSEAREGCLQLGMGLEQIRLEPETCLSRYWTVDRLRRSERTTIDWLADNGEQMMCSDPGWVEPTNSDGICELIGSHRPALPDQSDDWWRKQATRDPGRTTVTGLTSPLLENGLPGSPPAQ